MTPIASSSCIKAAVVREDEKETGLRTILNYRHTIAHDLEVARGYNRLLHGEAVSVGMMGEAEIAEKLALLDREAVRWVPLRTSGRQWWDTMCPRMWCEAPSKRD